MEQSKATRGLVLRATLSGVLMPIERVPDPVLPQKMVGDEAAAASEVGGLNASEAILISNTAGLHARPAAVLANLARKYTSSIWMQRGDSKANAKSISSLMNLDLRFNNKVNLAAQGPDARDALTELVPLIISGLGEEGASAPAPASRIVAGITKPAPVRRSDDPNLLLGVTASSGLVVGTVLQVRHQDLEVPETGEAP